MAIDRAIKAGKAFIELFLDDSKAIRSLRTFGRRLESVGNRIASFGAVTVGIGGGILAAGLAPAVKLASDYQETLSKFKVVYGDLASAQKVWVDEFAAAVGRSRLELTGFAAEFQDLLVPIGVDEKKAAEVSRVLTQLSVDIASFNNEQDADVANNLSAALTGSGEVMKQYGVIVNETAVKQELLNKAINPKEATEAQKVLARLDIILRSTTNAQGDAIRTAGGFANQLKKIRSQITDTAVEIGSALLPTLTRLVTQLSKFGEPVAKFIRGNQSIVTATAVGVAGLTGLGAAAIAGGLALSGFGTVATTSAAIVGVLGGPITAVAAGVLLAVAATTDWKKAFSDLSSFVSATVLPSIRSIGEFISQQDYAAAGELMILTLEKGIIKGFGALTAKLNSLRGDRILSKFIFGADPTAGLNEVEAEALKAGVSTIAGLEEIDRKIIALRQKSRLKAQTEQKEVASSAKSNIGEINAAFLEAGIPQVEETTNKVKQVAEQITDQLRSADIGQIVQQAEQARQSFEASIAATRQPFGLEVEPNPAANRQIDELKKERESIENAVLLAKRDLVTDRQDPNFRGIEFLNESVTRITNAQKRIAEIGEQIAALQVESDPRAQFDDMIAAIQDRAQTAFARFSPTSEGRVAEQIFGTQSRERTLENFARRQAKAAERTVETLAAVEKNTRNFGGAGVLS